MKFSEVMKNGVCLVETFALQKEKLTVCRWPRSARTSATRPSSATFDLSPSAPAQCFICSLKISNNMCCWLRIRWNLDRGDIEKGVVVVVRVVSWELFDECVFASINHARSVFCILVHFSRPICCTRLSPQCCVHREINNRGRNCFGAASSAWWMRMFRRNLNVGRRPTENIIGLVAHVGNWAV